MTESRFFPGVEDVTAGKAGHGKGGGGGVEEGIQTDGAGRHRHPTPRSSRAACTGYAARHVTRPPARRLVWRGRESETQ